MSEFTEPIVELSPEEFQKRKAQNAPEDDEAMTLGRSIWKWAMKGLNRDEISRKLKIPLTVLDESLKAYHGRLGFSIDHYRLLDNQRIEKMVTWWLPVVLKGPKEITYVDQGEGFGTEAEEFQKQVDADFDMRLKASQFVLQAIEKRLKVLGATQDLLGAGMELGSPQTERQIVIWLRDVMPSIERLTREFEATPVKDAPAQLPENKDDIIPPRWAR
jgi:hypothetical protein